MNHSDVAREAWRLFPHTFASEISVGKYKQYSHIKYLAGQISRELAKGNARIIIEMPPRHGKSELISKWLPVWFLDNNPDKRVILTSYEADFAASWGRKVRDILESNAEKLRVKLSASSTAANRFDTTLEGGMICAGAGGPITGRGGHLIIIDDPIKNWEDASSLVKRKKLIDWFQSDLYTRLEPNGSIILLMQRWHQDDLSGWIQRDHSDKWRVIRLPAIAEDDDEMGRAVGEALCQERYPIEALERLKKGVGPYFWVSKYQQRPSIPEGDIIKKAWLRYYTELPAGIHSRIMCVDLAQKDKEDSDFCVLSVWGQLDANIYLIDLIRGRWDFPAEVAQMLSFQGHHKVPTIYVEDKANGPALISTLRNKIRGIIPFDPEGSKESRLLSCSASFASGNVWLPQNAPWLNEYIEEICGFPKAPNDDQVDVTTMAILKLVGLFEPRIWDLTERKKDQH